MKVKELIAQLSEYNGESEARIATGTFVENDGPTSYFDDMESFPVHEVTEGPWLATEKFQSVAIFFVDTSYRSDSDTAIELRDDDV
jgi:hypothetical protein